MNQNRKVKEWIRKEKRERKRSRLKKNAEGFVEVIKS